MKVRLKTTDSLSFSPCLGDYPHLNITSDAMGFRVSDLRSATANSVQMRWTEVICATVFKRDLITTDCICLLLARADKTSVELNEEMPDWNSFVEALPQHLPGCMPFAEWYPVVALPPFAPNVTDIFRRDVAE